MRQKSYGKAQLVYLKEHVGYWIDMSDENATLMIKTGPMAGKQWPLIHDEAIIGRDISCNIIIDDRNISRQHVRIRKVGEGYTIVDLGSKNGTKLNNHPLIGEQPLQNSDVIDIGPISLTFVGPFSTFTNDLRSRFTLDRQARRVFIGDREVLPPLSMPQYRLLELLIDAKGAVCTRDDVVQHVWGSDQAEGVSEQAVDALVRRLRDRLLDTNPMHNYIITVRGHGFRFE
jgi:pSer/pThr/pTyr-binding forkhead associated (FHA) protein